MKPRLVSAELTAEDAAIWRALCAAPVVGGFDWWPFDMGRIADQRDADLMLHLGQSYADVREWQRSYPGVVHSAWAYQGIAIPRDLEPRPLHRRPLDLSYFA